MKISSRLLTAVAMVALISVPAFADQQEVPQANQSAPPPVVAPTTPAPSPGPATTPPIATQVACTDVVITRPDVGALRKFTVTFHGADLDAVKSCNPNGEVDQTTNGVRLVVHYGQNGAKVSLPSTMVNGEVLNGRCVADKDGNAADAIVYKANWTGGLPVQIDLTKLDRSFYDFTARLDDCRQLIADGKHH